MTAPVRSTAKAAFEVPLWLHLLGGWVHRHPKLCIRLANLETASIERSLNNAAVEAPIYVSGLARSGSTLLHDIISSHPAVATHRVKDYPFVFTPYWWRRASKNLTDQAPRERVHRDGVMITAESPDALEEMLWMAFFSGRHDPAECQLLSGEDAHPPFDSFYTAHLQKLILAEGRTRYAAKANYHVARLPYLLRLFPDARFVIPVREPAAHVASLVRQQKWFSLGQRAAPRALAFMRRSGHFEFGLDRRPINLGDDERVRQISDDWASGREALGLARLWNMVYAHLAALLASDARAKSAALAVRFEDVCDAPVETLRRVFEHCRLPGAEGLCQRRAAAVRKPAYYGGLSGDDLAVVRRETAATASLWGY